MHRIVCNVKFDMCSVNRGKCGVSIARTALLDFRSVTDTQVAGGSKLDSQEAGREVKKKVGQ